MPFNTSSRKVGQLLNDAANVFADQAVAKLDAQLLLAYVLDKDRTWLYTWNDYEVNDDQLQRFSDLVNQRTLGKPIAYILGYKYFWKQRLFCHSSTLIPRPETELLVEQALLYKTPDSAKVLDLGTGTGAIAIALAAERPLWTVYGVDQSAEAIVLAQRNAKENLATNVRFYQSDWFSKVTEGPFDLIVCNPPYIDPDHSCLSEGDVRFEPVSALVAGRLGMENFESICSKAKQYLTQNGRIIFEHGYDQAKKLSSLLTSADYQCVETAKDLSDIPRVTTAVNSPAN